MLPIRLLTMIMIYMASSNSSDLLQFYKDNGRKWLLNWNKPLFGSKHSSLQKVLENANKKTERSTYLAFITKHS
jgi:hypothetical protein